MALGPYRDLFVACLGRATEHIDCTEHHRQRSGVHVLWKKRTATLQVASGVALASDPMDILGTRRTLALATLLTFYFDSTDLPPDVCLRLLTLLTGISDPEKRGRPLIVVRKDIVALISDGGHVA